MYACTSLFITSLRRSFHLSPSRGPALTVSSGSALSVFFVLPHPLRTTVSLIPSQMLASRDGCLERAPPIKDAVMHR
jgi:hypothetical protein